MIHLEKLLTPADLFAEQLRGAKIVGWQREVIFIPGRKFKADFIWPHAKLIVEVDGGTWARKGVKKCRFCGETPRGRHSTGIGRERDCEKQALAVLTGYRYIVVTSGQVKNESALTWIRHALKREKK